MTRVKLTLEQAIKGRRGSRGIALLLNFGARWGGWSIPASTNKDVLYLPVQYVSKQIPGLKGRALSIGFSTLSFPSVKEHFRKTGIPQDRKFTLLFDTCN
jgi:hypothetical protein